MSPSIGGHPRFGIAQEDNRVERPASRNGRDLRRLVCGWRGASFDRDPGQLPKKEAIKAGERFTSPDRLSDCEELS
jgi:hypothetical protein